MTQEVNNEGTLPFLRAFKESAMDEDSEMTVTQVKNQMCISNQKKEKRKKLLINFID